MPRPTAPRSPSPAQTTRGCTPATALSASASRPVEAEQLLHGAPGETPEELIAHALQGRAADEHPHARHRRPRSPTRPRRRARRDAAAAAAGRVRRPGGAARAARRGAAAARARGGARSRAARGPARPGQDPLARILAEELGVPFVQTAGPALERKGDVAALLTSLEPRSVFFIDEIHRLPRAVEEIFYPAMEDRQLPITLGRAPAQGRHPALPPFTLVGATTRAGLLTTPLRDRFGDPAPAGSLRAGRARADRRPLAPASSTSTSTPAARARSPSAPAARRASPTACSSACATTRRCAATARSTRRRDAALQLLGVDDAGLDRLDRELLEAICGHSAAARSGCRRWRSPWRGGGHDRGRLRALPAAARASSSARRAGAGDAARVPAPGAGRRPRRPRCSEPPALQPRL